MAKFPPTDVRCHDLERAAEVRRALLVTSRYTNQDLIEHIGQPAYSYRFVYQAFAPLLERWGRTIEVSRPRHELDAAIECARRRELDPIHLSFLPLHLMHHTRKLPNVAVPAWEFPDIPCTDLGGDPRHNWARIADEVALIVTHTNFSRDAFLRAGVRTPVHVVPVPVQPEFFTLPAWQPGQRVVIDCPCFLAQQPESLPQSPPDSRRKSLKARVCRQARSTYKKMIKPWLPRPAHQRLARLVAAIRAARWAYASGQEVPLPPARRTLDLTGVVYTTIFNPFDGRKNWGDMLSGFLLALGDRADATLVLKLVVSPSQAPAALHEVLSYYRGTGLTHRCQLVIVTAYLSDSQMLELARASTYYLNTSRAEGSCLPLQDFLAAGRPAVAPANTGMADALDERHAFLIASHPEPTCWPQDTTWRTTTTWHRLVWQSLYEQLRVSYAVARENPRRYAVLAEHGRDHMSRLTSFEAVWPRLAAALNAVGANGIAASARG
jgi:glycosyltransferase involved in cell wall biosynthesis